ncbi:hypothetical protein ACTFIW_007655 [Dictyostelium discoideum]
MIMIMMMVTYHVDFESNKVITQCECHSSVVKLKAYRKELTELYESIGDRYNGYKNSSSVVGCKNIESIKIIDKGDEYYKNGKFDDAHEQYIKAFMLCKSEDYDYHDGFSLISTILLKLSSSHYSNQYSFYNSRLGTDRVIYRSYNYLKVASSSLLEPNNLHNLKI